MKIQTLTVLAAVATPLIATGSASAGFIGISTVSKPNPFVSLTVNVYAEFDRPGEDHMLAVQGTPDAPLVIEVVGGTFYNSPFGGDTAPHNAFFPCCPSLVYDTFVTIGLKAVGAGLPTDELVIAPGFPLGITGSVLATTTSGWSVLPTDAQGDPFDPDYVAGDGRVLIGQFATNDGSAIQGTMLLQFISNGVADEAVVSFFHVPGPGGLVMIGVAGLIGTRRRRRRGRRP